ncbi:MAG: sulfite exporter TauE/SafE family protein [Pseudomonadales bacterium]
MLEIWQGVLLLLVGSAAGFMNVIAGGGSLLTVPVMLFMGVPGPVANGTNRIAILAQNATAIATFFRGGYSDFKLSLSLALAAVPGAVVGASVGANLDGVWFDRIVALVMIVVLVLMATEKKTNPIAESNPPSGKRLLAGHICMLGAGFWGGFIQLGVGFVLMPILHRVLGFDLVRVNMHKVFIIFVYTVTALAVFAAKVELLWMMGLCLAVGNSVGGWFGARVSIDKGSVWIKLVFNAVLVLFIVKLLFFSQ